MHTPPADSTQPHAPDAAAPETPVQAPGRVRRPLLRQGAVARVREALALAGAEGRDALLADVDRHAAYLERCAREAESVLNGKLDAADRLWLLLREPAEARLSVPTAMLGDAGREIRRGPPGAVDGEALLRLVAGVVRAANQPSEADAMLDALGSLLQPLFLLDAAAAAAEHAGHGDSRMLETLVTARLAPRWRDALAHPVDPAVVRPPATRPVLDHDHDHERVPFNSASWRDDLPSHTLSRWDSLWGCIDSTRMGMSRIDRFGPRYHIESISNPDACAGQTLTIRGTGFGPAGRVSFPSPDPDDPAFGLGAGDDGVLGGVIPARWTDTEIDVVVPAWATAGELHLNAFTRHRDPCATIDVYRLGNSVFFRGGLATVYQVSLGGVEIDLDGKVPPNLTPGDAVAVSWKASGGPTTRIKIQLMHGATVLLERDGLPSGFGDVVLPIPDPEPREPRSATLVFTATSACGATRPLVLPVWLSVPPRLTIAYVEVTQGVQGDLADVLARRGMPTVAHKDTAVRVHMNCDRGGWYDNRLAKITGALLVDGRRLPPTNVRVLVPPDRGFAAIRGLSNPNYTNNTLNFTIPAAWLTPGPHTLTVQIVCDDPSGRIVLGQNVVWTWIARPPLRVRVLNMGPMPQFSGNEFMLDYARRALDYLPTPLTDIGIARHRWHAHRYDLSDLDGWSDLLEDLEDLWDDADEASGVRWIGMVPASERRPGMTLGVQGLSGRPSIAVLAMADDPVICAHELGHSLGLRHIDLPAGRPGGPFDDADGGGLLRRPPFDVRPSRAVPLPAGDLMSYSEPVRPGISTWMRLFLNA